MPFVRFPTPAHNLSRIPSIEPIVRLQNNKGSRRLILTPPVVLATGFVKGDEVIIEHDDENVSLCQVRRRLAGEDAHGLLSQSKAEKHVNFTTAGTILVSAGYGPGRALAIACGAGYVVFDASNFPPVSATEIEEPQLKPWGLKTSPKIAIGVLRGLVAGSSEKSIARENLVSVAEVAAVRALVTRKRIESVKIRSKPGQELWLTEIETRWTQRFRVDQ